MAFCSNCGQEIDEKSKFCSNCGAPINAGANEKQEQRKTVYEGEIHKCPNCGEVLNSFTLTCPSCGYEIRGNKSSNSVHEFAMRLSQSNDEKQKIMLIRSFPIPNSKEDILEFVILASANIESKIDNELSDAWQAKFEQAYQKANMLFKDDDVFEKIQEIYINTTKKISKLEQAKKIRNAGNIISELMPVLPNLIVIVGWLLSIFIIIPMCGINLDNVGTNAYQLLLMLILILGVFLIPPFTNNESSLPRLIATSGLVLSIVFLIPLCGKNLDNVGTNAYQIILVIDIVCSIIIFIRMIKKRKETSAKLGGVSFIIALIVVAFFFAVYLISSLIASFNNHTDGTSGKDDSYVESFEWPKTGLATYIPKPSGTKGEIYSNDDEEFWVEVEDYSESEYEAYIEECKSNGFSVDSNKTSMQYEAYNEDGYYIDLMHTDYDNKLTIRVHIPYAVDKLEWPTQGLALLIPTPNAEHGEVNIDTHIQLSVYVGDTSEEEYKAYVSACIDKGFDVDYSKSDTVYDADDKKGNSLRVEYRGNNIMYISMYSYDAFDD